MLVASLGLVLGTALPGTAAGDLDADLEDVPTGTTASNEVPEEWDPFRYSCCICFPDLGPVRTGCILFMP